MAFSWDLGWNCFFISFNDTRSGELVCGGMVGNRDRGGFFDFIRLASHWEYSF
jgi:hypothetical protein